MSQPGSGIADAVSAPVLEAYYSEAVRAGTAARVRAQAGQSASSIVAAGLVASLTLAELEKQHTLVRLGGVAAVVLWAASALLYMRAVGAVHLVGNAVAAAGSSTQLVTVVLERAKNERDAVDAWQRKAARVAVAALTFTVVTFAAVALGLGRVPLAATVYLQGPSSVIVAKRCSTSLPVPAVVENVDQQPGAISLTVAARACGSHEMTFILPAKDVEAVVVHD